MATFGTIPKAILSVQERFERDVLLPTLGSEPPKDMIIQKKSNCIALGALM